MKLDALIVGGGPVGLTMAAELARYGLRIRIIDKAPQRTDKSKAIVIWSRTLELLDRAGCTRALLAAGMRAPGAIISTGGKQLVHVSFEGVSTPYPFGLMVPQCDTERLLDDHLRTFGVEIERAVELTGFRDSGDRVISTVRRADGSTETIESSWVIGCDGAHSTVRHGLGMEFQGSTLQSDWILADVHLSDVPNPDHINVMWHAEGVLAVFPITKDRFRVIADAGIAKGDAKRPDPTLEEVQAVLDQRGPGGIRASDPIWLASFRINERKVADYRRGRVFLAGDAAHIHSPAGGQGMNTGMQDAVNLAWKLALVHRGVCAESPLLDSYSVERSAVGDHVLAAAGRLTAVAIMKGDLRQMIRNHVACAVFGLGPAQRAMANSMTEVSIGYPRSPLTAHGSRAHGGPHAGDRAPIRAGEVPVGAGSTPRFALCSAPDSGSAAFLARHADLVEPIIRAPFHADGMWLVRPDGYVSVVAGRGDWEVMEAFLGSIARRG